MYLPSKKSQGPIKRFMHAHVCIAKEANFHLHQPAEAKPKQTIQKLLIEVFFLCVSQNSE